MPNNENNNLKKRILYKNVSIHACLTIKLLSSLLQIDLNSINYCLSGKNAFLLEFCMGFNLSIYYFHSFLNIFFEFFFTFRAIYSIDLLTELS